MRPLYPVRVLHRYGDIRRHDGELEVLLPTFSPALQTLYQKTPFCNGGKWLCVDVKDQALLEDVQRLILLKAKPVQKRSGKTED